MRRKIYLAANYTANPQMREVAERLRNLGHSVVCEWISGTHQGDDSEQYAEIDLRDIDSTDTLIFFSQDYQGSRTRGGKHVEFGYALAKGKDIMLVGERVNVFHHLSSVSVFADETALLKGLVIEAVSV